MITCKTLSSKVFLKRLLMGVVTIALLLAVIIGAMTDSSSVSHAAGSTTRSSNLVSVASRIGVFENNVTTSNSYQSSEHSSIYCYTGTNFSSTQASSGTYDYIATQADGKTDTTGIYSLRPNGVNDLVFGSMMLLNNEDDYFHSSDFQIDNGHIIMTTNPGPVGFAFTFGFSDDLINTLKDSLVSVSVKPYVVVTSEGSDYLNDQSDADSFTMRLDCFNNGIVYSGIQSKQTLALGNTRIDSGSRAYNMVPGQYNSQSFLQITLQNWITNNQFSAIIAEVGIELCIIPNEKVQINQNQSVFQVTGVDRNPNTSNEYAAIGNNVTFDLSLQMDSYFLTLDTRQYNENETTYMDGTMFRRLFLSPSLQGNGGEDEFIITWSCSKGRAAIDIESSNKSGQSVVYKVQSGDMSTSELIIVAKLCYRDQTNNSKKEFTSFSYTLKIDTSAPRAPELATTNSFYTKYIKDGKYYTTDASQSAFDEEDNPIQINLAYADTTTQTKPIFKKEAMSLLEGSPMVVYYKTSYVGTSVPTISSEKQSLGFDKNDDSMNSVNDGSYMGMYCLVEDEGYITYSDLFIDLHTADGIRTESGVWSIEFKSYDYVGNSNAYSRKYFIRVDITNYEFETRYILGDEDQLSEAQIGISYAKVSEDGKVPTKLTDVNNNRLVLRRGDRLVLQVKFKSQKIANAYILTFFSTSGINLDCRNNELVNQATKLYYLTATYNGTDVRYTFEVGDVYCNSPDTRVLTFRFKYRVSINVTNTTQLYDGGSKTVIAQVMANNGIDSTVKVTTLYYTDTERTTLVDINNSNSPINAGRYYYYSEILNNNNYYGNAKGELLIKPAQPNISTLYTNMVIQYGESLAQLDMDYSPLQNGEVRQHNEKLYAFYGNVLCSTLSTDGIVGYYAISSKDKIAAYYARPNAGVLTIEVVFTAVMGTRVGSEVTYDYDENGEFIVNVNYEQSKKNIIVTVQHETAVDFALDSVQDNGTGSIVDGAVVFTYNGSNRMINYSITSERTDEENGMDLTPFALVTFAAANSLTDTPTSLTYSENIPVSAGLYVVKVTLDEANCNYTGTKYWFMEIKKIGLTVTVTPKICEYQYETLPTTIATKDSVSFTSNVKFKYSFYYHDATKNSLNEMATEENAVNPEDIRTMTGIPLSAGKYVVAAEIDDVNYGGIGYATFTVNKVTNESTHLVTTWPTLNKSLVNIEYHISYGQPLESIIINDTYTIKYTYLTYITASRTTNTQRDISGKIYVVTKKYEDWVAERRAAGVDDENLLTKTKYIEYMQKYADAPYSVNAYNWFFCFIADDSDNFDLLYNSVNVIIGKAVVDWTKVTITPIEYETAITSIEDLTITNNVGRLYSTTSAVPEGMTADEYYTKNNYVYIYVTDEYEYSLTLTKPQTYSAGSTNIEVVLTPTDKINYSDTYSNSCNLVVNKKVLNVSFSKDDYTKVYKCYQESDLYNFIGYTGNTLELTTLRGNFIYDKGDDVTYTSATLTAGEYSVTYHIDNSNYSGSVTFNVEIEKSALSVVTLPSIANEANVIYYHNGMSNVTFFNGAMKAEGGEAVNGNFVLSAAQKVMVFGNAGDAVTLYFEFIPDDTSNYNEFYGDNNNRGYVNRIINRANVSSFMSIAVNGTYTYQDLTYNATGTKNYFVDNGYITYSLENKDGRFGDGLVWDLSITKLGGGTLATGAINAGSYTLRAYIDETAEPNYTGFVTTILTVNKKAAYFVLNETEYLYTYNGIEGVKKAYAGKSLAVGVTVYDVNDNVIQEAITSTFKQNDVTLNYTPSAIGYYDCFLSLKNSTNYTLVDNPTDQNSISEVATFLMIAVDTAEIQLINITQIYTVQKPLNVIMGMNDADCDVYYVSRSNEAVFDVLPVNAGVYDIYLVFDSLRNNGYSETIKAADISQNFVLTINKYEANIITNVSVSVIYTGSNAETISAYTSPYGLSLTYSYARDDEDYVSIASNELGALDAGIYSVKITVDDNNYKGETLITYTVQPAPLYVSNAPSFGTYSYNTEIAPVEISGPNGNYGMVGCAYDLNYDVEGEFCINVNTIKTLNAGNHRVTYEFIPTSGNYATLTGTVELSIVKQVLPSEFLYIDTVDGKSVGDFCILETGIFAVEYDSMAHYLDVSYDKTALYNYSSNNNDFSITVYYNGSTNRPRNMNSYTVNAVVLSKNYSCSRTWDYTFDVTKCTPIIKVLPTTEKPFKLGDNIVTADIQNSGEAVIGATGSKIDGQFTVTSQTFTKANVNKVNVTFNPNDKSLYETIQFTININVIGKDSITIGGEDKATGTTANGGNWTDAGKTATSKIITPTFTRADRIVGLSSLHAGACGAVIKIYPTNGATSLNYGATLGQFSISFECAYDGCADCQAAVDLLNSCGTLEFAENSNYVPNVDEQIKVVYKLTSGTVVDFEQYNNMSGFISLVGILNRIDLSLDAFDYEYLIFGEDINALKYILDIYDGSTLLIGIDNRGTTMTLDGTIVYTDTLSSVNIIIDTAEYATNGMVNVDINTRNYFGNKDVIAVRYISIAAEDINVGNYSKTYNGEVLLASELDISVRNSQLSISNGSYDIKVYDEDGIIVDGSQIGTYTVYVYVKDEINLYYGVKIIAFSISKRDISNELSLVKSSDTYASDTVNNVAAKWGDTELSAAEYTLMFKRAGAANSEYSLNTVFNAGVYDVKIIVSNEYYSGTAVCQYTVNPKSITMQTKQESYVSTYGSSYEIPEVSFKEADSGESISLDCKIYYYSVSYTKSLVMPTNADNYTVVVELDDGNYKLVKDNFAYVINKKSVSVYTKPQALSTSDGTNAYNLKYGQKLGELRLDNSGYVTSDDLAVPGTFAVAAESKNLILGAGTRTVSLIFTPTNKNYASTVTEIEIEIGKATATVNFTNLSTYYTGTSRKDEISYYVTPSIEIEINYKNTSNVELNDPVAAGNYVLVVSTKNPNYNVEVGLTQSGSTPIFTIYKAQTRDAVTPIASTVSVGESLTKSSLTNGAVYYEGFTAPVSGTFVFVQSSYVFTEAGNKTVQYKFIPADGTNYSTYTGTVGITISKGTATVSVSANAAVYGAAVDFGTLVFSTSPTHLASKVKYSTTYAGVTYKNGDIIKAGTYYFTCWIEDDNYQSKVTEFEYVVAKKEIDIDFIDSKGNVVTAYNTKYGVNVPVKVQMYDANDTTGKKTYLMKDSDTVYKNIIYKYTSRNGAAPYDAFVAPTKIETYNLTVTLVHENYTATKTIVYKIAKGLVENIEFDNETLMGQIYDDSIVAPIVKTTPTNVNYYIIYQGYEKVIPTSAGTYNITVYIDDENYETDQISAVFKINPKPLTIIDIKAEDKVYDGISTLSISGRLSGLLFNDEVKLTMTATTFNNEVGVGKHYVTITSYSISGLAAANYTLSKPTYDGQIMIYNNKVKDEESTSYILSTTNGFVDGTIVSFFPVDLDANKTSIWTKMVGVESKVIGYSITVNNSTVLNSDEYKICVEIPAEFRDKEFNKEFKVEFEGALKGQNISPQREGNYISFYASVANGQVVFTVAEMKYTYVVIAAILAIILISIIVVLILNPLQRRRQVSSPDLEKNVIKDIKKG